MKLKLRMTAVIGGVILIGCLTYFRYGNSSLAEGEKLSRQHCAACHAFPVPGLLDKTTWDKHVLPQMAFRMGFKDNNVLYGFNREDLDIIRQTLPPEPIITQEELDLIRQYYVTKAPAVLDGGQEIISKHTTLFNGRAVASFKKPLSTLLHYDTASYDLYIGTASNWLYRLDKHFSVVDSIEFQSPPSSMRISSEGIFVSTIGRLLPNDQSVGTVTRVNAMMDSQNIIIDSLKRPVYLTRTDVNRDGRQDFIVCNFGNFTGGLSLYLAQENNHYQEKILSTTPGARKVTAIDWNRDGFMDLVAQFAQGDERISVFTGSAGMDFKEDVLIRFPPVYGSSNYEIIDFNSDGYLDIITTNGDNGDYSNIVKPYHGIRIFENNNDNKLEEAWFFPMAGAWETRTMDFDRDGDLDIAAIALFPDNKEHAGQNFIYLENTGSYNFTAQIEPSSVYGMWMGMETGDFDGDGDVDIILSSWRFSGMKEANRVLKGHDFINLLLLDNQSTGHSTLP